MTFRLIVKTIREPQTGGADRKEHVFDLDREIVLIGRRSGVDVPLPHPDVGGVHLRLERQDGDVVLVNSAFDSGTTLNGEALEARERRQLEDNDAIGVAGAFELTYIAASPEHAKPTTDKGTGELARAMVRDVIAALGQENPEANPMLIIEEGPDKGKSIELPGVGGEVIVGRGETSDVVIVDPDISREQLRICRDLAGATLVDLGSKNGTFVDTQRLKPGDPKRLRHNTRIALGATVCRYHDPSEAYLASWTLADDAAAPADAAEVVHRESASAGDAASRVSHDDGNKRSEAPDEKLWIPIAIAGAVLALALGGLFFLLSS